MKINDKTFDAEAKKVPFFLPSISKEDRREVVKAMNSTMLTDGPILREFEDAFARFAGSRYAVGVSNATAALHLSLKSLGIGRDDEVLVPDMTFVATANAVILTGAKPVLVDVNYDDMNISVESILENMTNKTKAILPVHFAGKACDIQQITRIAKEHNLKVIEDCAHAIGTKKGQKHVGTFGDAGCFSFYPTKNITSIEGGMVTTNSKDVADYLRALRNHGITKSLSSRYSSGKPWDYDIYNSGYNYRLDEIRSALGLSQLRRISQINNKRYDICKFYNSILGQVEGISVPELIPRSENSYHLYIIKIQKKFGIPRDKLYSKLLKSGIRTTVHYKPLHLFTAFKSVRKARNLENSSRLYSEMLSLPLFLDITRKEQMTVCQQIRKFKE